MLGGLRGVATASAIGTALGVGALAGGPGAEAAPPRPVPPSSVKSPLPIDAKAPSGLKHSTSLAARKARTLSGTRYERTTRSAARLLAIKTFDSLLNAPAFSAASPSNGLRTMPGERNMLGSRSVIASDTKTGRRMLVNSTSPLTVPASGGKRALIDLSLRTQGSVVRPAMAAVPVSISRSRGAVAFPGKGFSIALSGMSPVATPAVTSRQVFFADARTDSDYAVRSLPAGAESFVQLRSRLSPEVFRLKVTMPAGARLQRAKAERPIPGDPPKAIAIVKNGKAIGYVSPATTIDADRIPVPTSTRIDGDSIVLTVRHRAADVKYPLLLDPQYYTQSSSCANGFSGWSWAEGGAVPAGYGHFGSATCVPAYASGLYQSMKTNSYYYAGQYAAFRFVAPPGSYIGNATFGNIAHYPYNSSIFTGIGPAPFFTSWYSNVSGYNPNNGGTVGNPFQAGYGFQGAILDTCFAPRCTGPAGNDGDVAALGLQAINANYTGANNPRDTMGYANVAVGDTHPPTFSSAAPASVDWNDDNGSVHSVNPSISDYGLGAYAIGLTGGREGFQNRYATCNYNPQPTQAPCPSSFATSLNYTLDEGINTLSLSGNDLVNNYAPGQTWTDKIDRTPPRMTLSGEAFDRSRESGDPLGGTRLTTSAELAVTAADGAGGDPLTRRSGAERIDLEIDGIDQADPIAAEPCATDSCTLNGNYTVDPDQFSDGDHILRVTAVDAVGNRSSQTLTVTIGLPSDIEDKIEQGDENDAPVDYTTPDSPQRSGSDATEEPAVQARAPGSALAARANYGLAEPKVQAFGDQRFADLQLGYARYIVPWNVIPRADQLNGGNNPSYRCPGDRNARVTPTDTATYAEMKAWYDAVIQYNDNHAQKLKMVVAFEHDRKDEFYCYLPNDNEYVAATRQFRVAFPEVKIFSPWNEPNFSVQPTSRRFNPEDSVISPTTYPIYENGARAAGRFWRLFRQDCGAACETVLAGEFTDGSDFSAKKTRANGYTFSKGSYFRDYVSGMGDIPPDTVWSWHAYSGPYSGEQCAEVQPPEKVKRSGRYFFTSKTPGRRCPGDRVERRSRSTLRLRAYAASLPGLRPRIWLTEQGGRADLHVRDDVRYDGPTGGGTAQESDDALLGRAAADLTFLFEKMATATDLVDRVFVYRWLPDKALDEIRSTNEGFDSGLLNLDGSTRPSYTAFANALP